jgi:hypothetical protein
MWPGFGDLQKELAYKEDADPPSSGNQAECDNKRTNCGADSMG